MIFYSNYDTIYLKYNASIIKHKPKLQRFRKHAYFFRKIQYYNSVKEDFLKIKNLKEDLYKFIVKNNLKINLKIEGCMLYFAYDYLAYNDIKVSNIQKLEYGCEVGQTKLEILSNGVISGCPAERIKQQKTLNIENRRDDRCQF